MNIPSDNCIVLREEIGTTEWQILLQGGSMKVREIYASRQIWQ